jgi:hypothetical protein
MAKINQTAEIKTNHAPLLPLVYLIQNRNVVHIRLIVASFPFFSRRQLRRHRFPSVMVTVLLPSSPHIATRLPSRCVSSWPTVFITKNYFMNICWLSESETKIIVSDIVLCKLMCSILQWLVLSIGYVIQIELYVEMVAGLWDSVRSAENNGGGMPSLWQRRVVATAARERNEYGRRDCWNKKKTQLFLFLILFFLIC